MKKVKPDHSVAGFDMSLKGPAGCFVPQGWRIGDWKALRVESLEPDVPQTEAGRIERLLSIVDHFARWAHRLCPDFVAIEDYAYSRRSSSVTKLAELGGAFRVEMYRFGHVLKPVTASQCRMLLLGRLPRKDSKDLTHAALKANGFPWASGDVMDAFTVANFLRSECGLPFLSLA